MLYTGESLHRRADRCEVRSAEDECYLLLSPSSKEPSFSWVLALVMVLGASLPSCITFTIHTPVQLWGPTCFALPEQYGPSPHPQQSGKVISPVGFIAGSPMLWRKHRFLALRPIWILYQGLGRAQGFLTFLTLSFPSWKIGMIRPSLGLWYVL